MTPGSSSCNWRLMMAHWSCPVLQMWLLRPQGAQEEMVAIALAEEKLWWLHRACVAQNRDRSCKEELAHADHEHGGRVGGVYAHHAAARFIRVTELENDPKSKEEDKHELDHAAERVIAPLAEGLGLLLQR
eukprot:scaffold23772_cov63-Phaeocystis_antarctica.AAC.6